MKRVATSALPNLEETTLRRLAFVRYLFTLGVEQSQRPEPLSSASILNFHDSVEFFLHLAAETHDASVSSNTGLLDYWDILKQTTPGGLGHKASMARLNKTRVGLKHHGTLVSQLDVRDLREATRRFFTDNTPRLFGIAFDRISFADLVLHPDVRADLQKAEDARDSGDLAGGLAHAAVAFQRLLAEYERAARRDRFGSPRGFGESFGLRGAHMRNLRPRAFDLSETDRLEAKLAEFVEDVKQAVDAMQEGMEFMRLGIDYRRYMRFKELTPVAYLTMGASEYKTSQPRDGENRTIEDVDYCIEFVIETALKLQDGDVVAHWLQEPSSSSPTRA